MIKNIFVYLAAIISLLSISFFAIAQSQDEQVLKSPELYNSEGDDAIMGQVSQEPDQPVGYGTIESSITPDNAMTQYPAEDAPVPDNTLEEYGLQSSVLNDDTMRSQDGRQGAGPDTTLRDTSADDSDIQENASPYAPTPDLFSPQKKQ